MGPQCFVKDTFSGTHDGLLIHCQLRLHAQVYRAVLDGVQEVAVKFLNRDDVSNIASNRKKFKTEIDIMLAARDPNIVSCKGAFLSKVSQFACSGTVIVQGNVYNTFATWDDTLK